MNKTRSAASKATMTTATSQNKQFPKKIELLKEHPEWRDSEQTKNNAQFDCQTRRNARSLHICAIPLTFLGVRLITRAFSDACESAQELPGAERPGIERFSLEEWRQRPAQGEKKMDGHVKFARGKQSNFRI